MKRVYLKRGNRNAQERKMEQAMSDFVEKKLQGDPTYDWQPARNIVELKDFYVKNCVEEATIVSETKTANSQSGFTQGSNTDPDIPVENAVPADEPKKERIFIDPMLGDSPIEREYVNEMNQDRMNNPENVQEPTQPSGQSMGEPTSFKDAFSIPNQDPSNEKSKDKKEKDKPKSEPINPGFEDMSGSRRNKQTKRFAKWITKGVCILLKEGFMWWTTKDINPSKLAEYEITNEIDLRILLTLEDGQDATVKQFFMYQFQMAQNLSEISEEEKEELTEALYEYLIEKGVTPNPVQNLMMVAAGIAGRMAIEGFKLNASTNSLLQQLRDMQNQTQEAKDVTNEPKSAEPETSATSETPETSTQLVAPQA